MYDDMYGSGIFDRKLEYSNKAKKMLKRYGKCRILQLNIYRSPLSSAIEGALNAISFGRWKSEKKKYYFDKLFHLAIVATVECRDRETVDIIIEKTKIVNISRTYKVSNQTETMPISINKVITLDKLLNNTLNNIGKRKFFIYDGFTNNCQWFIRYILESNDIYTTKIANFVFQDISDILKRLPSYVHRIQKAVTDMAAWYSKIVGKGISGGCNICMKGGCLQCGDCDRPDCENNNNDMDKMIKMIIELFM